MTGSRQKHTTITGEGQGAERGGNAARLAQRGDEIVRRDAGLAQNAPKGADGDLVMHRHHAHDPSGIRARSRRLLGAVDDPHADRDRGDRAPVPLCRTPRAVPVAPFFPSAPMPMVAGACGRISDLPLRVMVDTGAHKNDYITQKWNRSALGDRAVDGRSDE